MRVITAGLLILILIVSAKGYGQKYDFSAVDSFAIHVGKADSLSIPQLSYLLTDRFKDPVLKTRAIYTWIAHNISYDCPAFHSIGKRKADPKDVFRLRKAVCEGYANLFMEMCNQAGVMSLTIDGYARNGTEIIAEALQEPNHTWNAVRIGEEWKMVDVTWASGYTDKKVRSFTPQFSDTYFFPDPYKFLLNHYPKLNSWKPSRARLSKDEFSENPIIAEGYFQFELSAFTPKKGIIKAKQNEQVNLSFTSSLSAQINTVIVAIGEEKRQQVMKLPFTVNNDVITCFFSYGKPGSYPMTVYINDRAALKYQLDIQ